jgi:hypothetical protein
MLWQRRPPLLLRSVAFGAALAVASAGSGAPMCANLFAQALEPCAMHIHGDHAVGVAGARLTAQPASPSCHPGDFGGGCASAGTCPSGGPLAASLISTEVVLAGPSADRGEATPASLHCFVAPPPSPPPQA